MQLHLVCCVAEIDHEIMEEEHHGANKPQLAKYLLMLQPDRWLPLRQRASYINAQSKKKGGNQSMGVGMTQGSSSHGNAAGGGGGGGNGGGNKKKKGKK